MRRKSKGEPFRRIGRIPLIQASQNDPASSPEPQTLHKADARLWGEDREALSGLLFKEPNLPEEYFASRGSVGVRPPEAALMCAVVEDALDCFRKQFVSRTRQAKRVADEAKRWFFSDDSDWFFSFVSICAVLNLDPNGVRRSLNGIDKRPG
jgi:hypothetical protein